MNITHLGFTGLAIRDGTARLLLDPPAAPDAPTVVTWTETERVSGVRAGPPPALAAAPVVLKWLGVEGVALGAAPVRFGGWVITAAPYDPIPYATPREAMRKTASALRDPRLAVERLGHLFRRPATPPLALSITRAGRVVVVLGQALHRFTPAGELDRLVRMFGGCDVLVVGTDFDDEEAPGRLSGVFGARTVVVADLTGPVRRMLRLPTRPLETVLASAPPGTKLLCEGGGLELGD